MPLLNKVLKPINNVQSNVSSNIVNKAIDHAMYQQVNKNLTEGGATIIGHKADKLISELGIAPSKTESIVHNLNGREVEGVKFTFTHPNRGEAMKKVDQYVLTPYSMNKL